MAKQTINIGTVANDGTGDPLRSAFSKTNDNFTELYNGQSISIVSDTLTLTRADGTTSTVDLSSYLDEDARAISSGVLNTSTGIVTFTRDDASTFTIDLSGLKDVASVDGVTIDYNGSNQLEVKDNGLEADKLKTSSSPSNGQYPAYNSTTGGFDWGYPPTAGVDGVTIEYNLSNELRVKDNAISYEKIDNEFNSSISLTASATVDVDFDIGQVFNLTPDQNTTLNITNPKIGITKCLLLTGGGSSSTLAFTVGGSAGTFNKIAGDYDDTSSTKNFIQIICVSATEFWYSISQIAS